MNDVRKYDLNLINKDLTDIGYEISKFPDGQQTIDLFDNKRSTQAFSYTMGSGYNASKNNLPVYIKIRLKSFQDLEILIAATKILQSNKITNIILQSSYLIGARSDRRFNTGGVHYLKEVISPIINSLNFTRVDILDPHSDVVEACINNLHKISPIPKIKKALTVIDNKNNAETRIALVSPDAGASKKIFDVAKNFQIPKIISANKVRDIKTGKIIKTEVLATWETYEGLSNLLVVDDICDGGRTFIELAKAIRETGYEFRLHLFVSHGIFSKGVEPLLEHYDTVHTTDSYSDDLRNIDRVFVH